MNRIGQRLLTLACVVLLPALFGAAATAAQHETEGREQHFRMHVSVVDEDGNLHEETIEVVGPRAFLGVILGEGSEGGARIESVVEGSAAERAGLREGDIIVGLDGDAIEGPWDLTRAVLKSRPGANVEIEIERDGARQTVTAELGERGDGDWSGALREMLGNMDFNFDFKFEPGDMRHGWAFRSERPRLGVELVDVTDELREHLGGNAGEGLLVGKVQTDTPAYQAGVEVGDLIVGVDGESVGSAGELRRLLRELDGQTFGLDVIRDARPISLGVSIPEREVEAER